MASKPNSDTQPSSIPINPANIHVVTSKGRKPTFHLIMDTDDLVKEQTAGFVNFIREHAVVGLAVGFVIGTQAQKVMTQLVDSFIKPGINVIIGGANLDTRIFEFRGEKFLWGTMVYALLNLLVVLATVYILIKLLKLDRLDKPKDKKS